MRKSARMEYNVLKGVSHVGCDTFAQYIDIPEACTTVHVDSPSPLSNFLLLAIGGVL